MVTSTTATRVVIANSKRHAAFAAFIVVSSVAFYKTLSALIQYSLRNDSSSHIILIPFIALFLIYLERQRIFSITSINIGPGVGLALVGIVLFSLANRSSFPRDGNWQLSLQTLAGLLVCAGGFLVCYGFPAFRAAVVSLLFV